MAPDTRSGPGQGAATAEQAGQAKIIPPPGTGGVNSVGSATARQAKKTYRVTVSDKVRRELSQLRSKLRRYNWEIQYVNLNEQLEYETTVGIFSCPVCGDEDSRETARIQLLADELDDKTGKWDASIQARCDTCRYDQLIADYEEELSEVLGIKWGLMVEDETTTSGSTQLDWDELWREDNRVDWLIDGIMERGELCALFGAPKCGKSLLALEWVLRLVRAGENVLYLDRENRRAEVRRRLQDMDATPAELRRLRFYEFPAWADVDTERGAAEIVRRAQGTALVVFDSWARFFAAGTQSDDGPANRAYRQMIMPLRAQGIAVLRIDHTTHEGKRPSGTVVKLADIDHGWRVNTKDDTRAGWLRVTLTHSENRTGRGADVAVLRRPSRETVESGVLLRHEPAAVEPDATGGGAVDDPGAVATCVARLDELSIPVNWSVRQVQKALREAGTGFRTGVLSQAMATRRDDSGVSQ